MVYVDLPDGKKSFQEIYRMYYKKIYNYIFYALLNKETAEDLTGNTFFKALRFIKEKNPKIENFNAWIYRIALNEILKYKSRKLHKDQTNSFEEDSKHLNEFIGHENKEDKYFDFLIIENVLKKLKDTDRNIIILHFFENKNYSEISQILKINQNTLRSKVSRLLKKMKIILKKEYDDKKIKRLFLCIILLLNGS